MHIPVENEKHLVRDTTSNAILNTDKSALRTNRMRRKIMHEKDVQLEEMSNRIQRLEELIYSIIKE